jgi:hypothetical protein
MSSWRINAIHTDASSDRSHQHISAVHASSGGHPTSGVWLSRTTVINDIRSGRDSYYVDAGGSRTTVVVVRCPLCNFADYLRTEKDATTADNLLSQPRESA